MKTTYKLVGLQKVGGGSIIATLEHFQYEETFTAKLPFDKNKQKEFWDYCKDNWGEKKIAIVSHSGFFAGTTTPINPIIISIELIHP